MPLIRENVRRNAVCTWGGSSVCGVRVFSRARMCVYVLKACIRFVTMCFVRVRLRHCPRLFRYELKCSKQLIIGMEQYCDVIDSFDQNKREPKLCGERTSRKKDKWESYISYINRWYRNWKTQRLMRLIVCRPAQARHTHETRTANLGYLHQPRM